MYAAGYQSVHMKTVTLTEFRKNIFRMVDEAVSTGEPIVIDRNGARVIIRGEKKPPRPRKNAPNAGGSSGPARRTWSWATI